VKGIVSPGDVKDESKEPDIASSPSVGQSAIKIRNGIRRD